MSDKSRPPFLTSLAHHAADPFRLLVESVVDYAIYMVDPGGIIASWNPGAERIYGYRATEIVGQPFSFVYSEADRASGKAAAIWAKLVADGHIEFENYRVRRDGTKFWAWISASILKDYFGNDVGYSVVTRDITERVNAAEALRRERDLSDAVLDSLPGIYYMYDEQRTFLRWNRRFEAATGRTAEEIRRMHPLDIFDGDDKPRVAERIETVFASGVSEVEADLVAKDGSRTPYYFNGVRAVIGGVRCLLGMGIDITEQRRAHQRLRSADERLRTAVRAASIGLWDWDLRTNRVFFSTEWKRQVGCEEHEIGDNLDEWVDRLHPEDRENSLREFQAFRENPHLKYEVEFRLRHKDGTYRWIFSQAAPVFENGTAVRLLGSHVDVTERYRLFSQLQQAQKMEAVGQLAGGVAHDFNNLLTVINGYTDLLMGRFDSSDPLHEVLGEIYKAGERAAALTRQLLAFSRQQVLEPRVLNLNRVVADAEKLLKRLIGEDILLASSLEPALAPVKADPGQIEQVLLNLAVNARDAMPRGGRITIETQNTTLDEHYCRGFPDLAPGEYVLLAFSDNGCGMDETVLSRVFEPFFTTKTLGKGTGLGLATVHGIVKQSRGHVAVYSEPGHGTTFKVYLPRAGDLAVREGTSSKSEPMPRGAEIVLLVEDEDSVRTLAQHVLENCGYRVIAATDGHDALALAQRIPEPIDLLISDVVMPHLGGRELAERIVAAHPAAKVLFLSGYTNDAVIRHGVLDAEFAFLQKPFTPAALARKVRSVLDAVTASP
ncbi:MAG: PAS domain S-box protein [Gemmataceae bacterium]